MAEAKAIGEARSLPTQTLIADVPLGRGDTPDFDVVIAAAAAECVGRAFRAADLWGDGSPTTRMPGGEAAWASWCSGDRADAIFAAGLISYAPSAMAARTTAAPAPSQRRCLRARPTHRAEISTLLVPPELVGAPPASSAA